MPTNKTEGRCRMRMSGSYPAGRLFCNADIRGKKRSSGYGDGKRAFLGNDEKDGTKRIPANEDLPSYWFRNIERGTKGAWHIHLVITENGDTASILKKAWKYGGVHCIEIRMSDKIYDEDFTKLASYITKSERTEYKKADGTPGKPSIRRVKLQPFQEHAASGTGCGQIGTMEEEPKPKKGYYIARTMRESIRSPGINTADTQ